MKVGGLQHFGESLDVIECDGSQCCVLQRVRKDGAVAGVPCDVGHFAADVGHEDGVWVSWVPSGQCFVDAEVDNFKNIIVGGVKCGEFELLDHCCYYSRVKLYP